MINAKGISFCDSIDEMQWFLFDTPVYHEGYLIRMHFMASKNSPARIRMKYVSLAGLFPSN